MIDFSNYSGSEPDGIAGEGGFDGFYQVLTFLAYRRDIAADHAISLGSGLTAKDARDFLLHRDHA